MAYAYVRVWLRNVDEAVGPLEPELTSFCDSPTWMLRPNPESSAKAAHIPRHEAIVLVHILFFERSSEANEIKKAVIHSLEQGKADYPILSVSLTRILSGHLTWKRKALNHTNQELKKRRHMGCQQIYSQNCSGQNKTKNQKTENSPNGRDMAQGNPDRIEHSLKKISPFQANKMAQWVRALGYKPGDLSLICGTHI